MIVVHSRLLHTSSAVCFPLRGIPTVPLLLPLFYFIFFLKSDWKLHLGNQVSSRLRLPSQTSSLVRRWRRANFPAERPCFRQCPFYVLSSKVCASVSSAPPPPLPSESLAASWRSFPFHSTCLTQISHLSGSQDPQMAVRMSDWNPYSSSSSFPPTPTIWSSWSQA